MEKKKLRFDEESPLPDRFELLAEIGRGAMSVVYRAYDHEVGQEVAVKLLPEGARGGQLSERYHREGRELARIKHPNVVGFFGEGVHRGRDFLVLEYIPGGDLRRFLARPRGRNELLQLFLGICRGLAELHARGLVHRDLKPENVLIGADGEARLSDLGLVRSLSSNTHLTSEGALVGTLCYLSPEQILSGELSAAADLYALGACLYEALVGRALFDGKTEFEILQKHVRDEPTRPRELVPDLDPELEELVLRLVSKDPARRPSADEAARVLADYLLRAARGPISAPEGGAPAGTEALEGPSSPGEEARGETAPPTATPPMTAASPREEARGETVPPTATPPMTAASPAEEARGETAPPTATPPMTAASPGEEARGETATPPMTAASPGPSRSAQSAPAVSRPRHSLAAPLAALLVLVCLLAANAAMGRYKTLLVGSTPEGATVLLDGQKRGSTPQRLTGLALGRHELRIERQGFAPHFQAVELAIGRSQTPIQVELRPLARVPLSVTPADARVLLDGEPVELEQGAFWAAPGRHRLELSHPDAFPVHQDLELQAGDNPPLEIALRSARTAHLRVQVTPSDARLLLDGKPWKPGDDLPPGTHRLEARRQGYQAHRQEVHLVAGQTLQLPLVMKRNKPSLRLISTPAATVYLDGQKRGRTPLTLAGLEPGPHQIKLTAPGYLSAQKRLTLALGADRNLSFRLEPVPPPPPPPPAYLPPPYDPGPAPYYPPPAPPPPGPAPTPDF